jgi:rhodanese-related sulfurtransferase
MNELKINTIDVHELHKRREIDPNLCIIDVREDDEWQEQHIPRAVHIPKDLVAAQIEQIVPDHNQPIYLHCKGGVRSMHAAAALLSIGYTSVYSIDGGITAWRNAGYPIEP